MLKPREPQSVLGVVAPGPQGTWFRARLRPKDHEH